MSESAVTEELWSCECVTVTATRGHVGEVCQGGETRRFRQWFRGGGGLSNGMHYF